jgi:hypothetical protein
MTTDEITKDIIIALIPRINFSTYADIDERTKQNVKTIGELYQGIYKAVSEAK